MLEGVPRAGAGVGGVRTKDLRTPKSCASVQCMNDHLAAPVRELLALYEEEYSDVRFPELDLAVLQAAAADVEQAMVKVAAAEASIEPLREQVKVIEGELTQKVARALAFLKVFVEGDEAAYARLDVLTQALLARRSPRRATTDSAAPSGERARRGRKPKANAASTDASSDDMPTEEVLAVNRLLPSELAEADLPSSALTAFERVAE